MTFSIEPMVAADAERCAELERLLFAGDGPWSAAAFRAELAAPHVRYVVARTDTGRVVGYAGLALLGNPSHPEAEVHTIGTDPQYMRRGIGGALLAELLQLADARADRFFSRCGPTTTRRSHCIDVKDSTSWEPESSTTNRAARTRTPCVAPERVRSRCNDRHGYRKFV